MKELLWKPSEKRIQDANMTRFIQFINTKYKQNIKTYNNLYEWSIGNIPAFWETMSEFGEVIFSKTYDRVLINQEDMLQTEWFLGAKLNFAENLLRFRDDRIAIVFKSETDESIRISYAELYDQVARLARALRDTGVTVGDRVVGLMPNMIETVIAMLATTSLGAVWSSCSPDFGVKAVQDRFSQVQPKVLFAADGYYYGGKIFSTLDKINSIVEEIDSIERVIVVPYTSRVPNISNIPSAIGYNEYLAKQDGLDIEFAQLPFDHPIYIMFSSGTTGVPKCIVHGAGGTLIQHLKELMLHTDLKPHDKIFYYTTCSWMMWNWLVSSLAIGATIVLFDGSPFYPDEGVLWKLVQDEKISVFGTSAKYIATLEKNDFKPDQIYDMQSLNTILSTGSPLLEKSYHYIYRHVKKDVCLSSISGGTDIISCFALGNPIGPVIAGELQCRGLGMKVDSFGQDGLPHKNKQGELVCTAPFPSMPIYFWNDRDKLLYKKNYFSIYPNIWRHGDYVEITDTGGLIIYGRSDATLNPGGVRIGTAEIYRQVECLPEVSDSIAVGQEWENDTRVILFVKLVPGSKLDAELINNIKTKIRLNASPRHVPAKVIQVKDIPYTLNGKKVELAVYNVINNKIVANKDILANPEVLVEFHNLPELSI